MTYNITLNLNPKFKKQKINRKEKAEENKMK